MPTLPILIISIQQGKCDRALQLQEEGMEYDASLSHATGDRLRPIFMKLKTKN
jgi:hypothetical protein